MEVPSDVVVVHIRLDDFIHEGHNSEIIHPNFYINELKKFTSPTNCWIVIDELKNEYEKNYINYIIKQCDLIQFELKQSSLLDDWNTIRNASYVISSNSTYSWTACYFNDKAKTIVYPCSNNNPNSTQVLKMFDSVWRTEFVDTIDYRTFDFSNSIKE
jgi:hypothetical protein